MRDNLVLAASNLPLPGKACFGYAWVGADLYFCDGESREAPQLELGEDGAYVAVLPGSEKISIGTDFFGFGKVYLYRSGNNWAVGRSMMGLADYAASSGWSLTKDFTQLQSWFLRGNAMIGGQLSSFRTVFKEISLVPAEQKLEIDRNKRLEVLSLAPSAANMSYSDGLQFALEEMCSRLRTLLKSEMPVSSDITGGQDSRLILGALVNAAGSDIDLDAAVRFKSQVGWKQDYAVATKIAKRYGIALNKPAKKRVEADVDYALELWRLNDLGVYSTFYPVLPSSGEIALNGCSPAYRLIYKNSSLGDEMKASRTEWISDDAIKGLEAAALDSLAEVPDDGDLRVRHYSLFRNRIHGGRPALRGAALSPLSSRALYQAATLLPITAIERSQFYADAMFSLDPELAEFEFDKPSKNWTSEQKSALTRVSIRQQYIQGGQVHGAPSEIPGRSPNLETRQHDRLAEMYYRAKPKVIGLLPPTFLDKADECIAEILKGNQQFAPVLGFVTTVILYGEVERLSNPNHSISGGKI
ncbi:hypothetical protein ACKFR8_05595 [Corynebacterium axilliensis]|uniref:hypothetical protein n=1 Tax=Corynebacterium sp. YSMAA5_1_F9 TaxID=3383591 RepID=UPI0038CF7646